MSTAILGLGTAAPRGIIAQPDAANIAATLTCASSDQTRILAALYRRSGVRRRATSLLPGEFDPDAGQSFFPPPNSPNDRGPTTAQRMARYAADAPPLAMAAARAALHDATLPHDAITHLVTVSCTGFVSPGPDTALLKALELAPTTARTHIGYMGCHGAINGLRVAAAFAQADPAAHVLLVAVELCSLHFQYGWSEENAVANALFADGAAACILASATPTAETQAPWRITSTSSRLFPDSEHAMAWRIGDHGFEMTLSPRLPSLLESHLRPWLESWLAAQGRTLAEIRSWAIHPGGPRIIDAVASTLNLPPTAAEPSRAVLAERGNMSSPTILFILDRLRAAAAPRPCLALAFGPGIAAEAALFE